MKRYVSLMLLFCLAISMAYAVKLPSWSKNAAKSVCTIFVYDKDGNLKTSGNGVFLSSSGACVTDCKLLSEADSIVALAKDGRKYMFKYVTGADDIYDIARFQVAAKKVPYLETSAYPAALGSKVYVVLNSEGKTPSLVEGVVKDVAGARNGDSYYTLSIKLPETANSCPVVDENGKIIGLAQTSGVEGEAYACGVRMTEDMDFGAFIFSNKILGASTLMKKLPLNENDAQVAMMMGAQSLSPKLYLKYIEQYALLFPESPFAYEQFASFYVNSDLDKAIENMDKAAKYYAKEDEAHFFLAKFVFANRTQLENKEGYGLQYAYDEVSEALALNPLPIYSQLKADIETEMGDYVGAKKSFETVMNSNLCTSEVILSYIDMNNRRGASSKEQIALIDSLYDAKKDILGKDTLTLIYTKALYLEDIAEYNEALKYLQIYSDAYGNNMTAEFFYNREQLAMKAKRYQQAMNDIERAVKLEPGNLLYRVEYAGINIIANRYEKALEILESCVKEQPQNPDINRLTALALLQLGRKEEACHHLKIAIEAGDELSKRIYEQNYE